MTRNGAAAEGSMLGLFSERLPGRLRREPGLSWGDSVNRGRERVSVDNPRRPVRPSCHPILARTAGPTKQYSRGRKQFHRCPPPKLKTQLPHDPAIPFPGIYPKN